MLLYVILLRTNGNSVQERIAAKLRQRLPLSQTDDEEERSASLTSDGSGAAAVATINSQVPDSRSRIGSKIERQSISPSAREDPPEVHVLRSSDHELSTAVFGKNSSSSSSSNSISGANSDATRPLLPSLPSSSQVFSSTDSGKVAGITSDIDRKEAVPAGVPVSLLEFRRLVAGGLPNAATRYFVVTGRGLAGELRVTQITQVRSLPKACA